MNTMKFPKVRVFQTNGETITHVKIGQSVYKVSLVMSENDIICKGVGSDWNTEYGYKQPLCEVYKNLRGKEFTQQQFFELCPFNTTFDKECREFGTGRCGRLYFEYCEERNIIKPVESSKVYTPETDKKGKVHYYYHYDKYKFVQPPFADWAEICAGDKTTHFDSKELQNRRTLEIQTNRDR